MDGRKVRIPSSWNELTSTVSTSNGCFSRATSESGLPMLPQGIVRWPQAFGICASNSVVVVFPFVPVTAMIGISQERQPSSSSLIVSIPREEKLRANGEIGSIPGLRTIQSYTDESRSASDSQTTRTPCARRLSSVDFSKLFSLALSSTVTCAPSDASSNAAALPLSPAPSTATFWFLQRPLFI